MQIDETCRANFTSNDRNSHRGGQRKSAQNSVIQRSERIREREKRVLMGVRAHGGWNRPYSQFRWGFYSGRATNSLVEYTSGAKLRPGLEMQESKSDRQLSEV